jgi:pyruvate dehydrogenase E1 component
MTTMIFDGFSHQLPDIDPDQTAEWVDTLDEVVRHQGKDRARYILMKLLEEARYQQVPYPASMSTPYVNTIPPEQEPQYPGNPEIEKKLRAYTRWNAAAMVVRANAKSDGIGGHLSTFASSATLYDVGWNHFFRGKADGTVGDFVYFQGHASPGMYSRAYLEGRFDEEQLDNFRQELGGKGLSSYPHPRLMPDFWEFPTVSMGIGPINSIYQARFNRYLHNRNMADTSNSKVWCFMGDGESDEPESLGALSVASREGLDNLIFVVNCNLQRLDGPVRGNGKIMQELEAVFRGAGWNVIKVVWGGGWDELLERDTDGVLLDKLTTTVDGEFQKMSVESGAYIREKFFGTDPRLAALVEHLSDEQLQSLPRGGHDVQKIYSAYQSATTHKGAPTVILAQTVKGWALGSEVEGRNSTHQIKKMTQQQFRDLRDRLHLHDEIPESALEADYPPYFRPERGTPEHDYLMERRRQLNGPIPSRVVRAKPLPAPAEKVFSEFDQGSKGREVSTTIAFALLLRNLLRDDNVGRNIVPIIPDEARTFGMDALFKEVKIYAPFGQLYEPVDANLMLSYMESKDGQILEEGITEAGSLASFTAAGTAYANHGVSTIPFFIFYSMFGFQRVGDLIWAFGDSRGKGFMMGATAGRTTLNGEGLQHEDGHSLVLASTYPNLCAYDPAFAYETSAIIQDGIKRMYGEVPEDRFYYITLYNENYEMPKKPEGSDEGIIRGIYKFSSATEGKGKGKNRRKASILFSGTAWSAAVEAQKELAERHDVDADLYSVTSYKGLREDGLSTERWNRLHPNEKPRSAYITETLRNSSGPYIAVTDFMTMVPDQVSRWIPGHFSILGTDGYGRSDTREALRAHFETDSANIVVATLAALNNSGDGKPEEVADAIKHYGMDPERLDPANM